MDRREFLQLAGLNGIFAGGVAATYLGYRRWRPQRRPQGEPSPSDDSPGGGDDDGEVIQNEQTRAGDVLFGVAPPPPESLFDPFEAWLGEQHAVVGVFVDMGASEEKIESSVHETFEGIWQRGHVPHGYFQPFFPTREDTSNEINRAIAAGEYDETLQIWAETLAEWAQEGDTERRIYLNLAPEFNGDWSPWSPAVGDEDEDDFVEMWRHTHDLFAASGLEYEHVQWIWTLNNSTRGVDRRACYPGDDYVDWAGIHGYNWTNWGIWQSAEDVYDATVSTIRSITDNPIAITEFGTSSETESGDHDAERKNEWIIDAFDYLHEEDIRMALWFNLVKETDWSVFGGEYGLESVNAGEEEFLAYPAYRDAVTEDAVLGSHPNYELPVTEDEFAGRFR